MENFHIYKYGERDRRANIEMKLNIKKAELRLKTFAVLDMIDGYFVNH